MSVIKQLLGTHHDHDVLVSNYVSIHNEIGVFLRRTILSKNGIQKSSIILLNKKEAIQLCHFIIDNKEAIPENNSSM